MRILWYELWFERTLLRTFDWESITGWKPIRRKKGEPTHPWFCFPQKSVLNKGSVWDRYTHKNNGSSTYMFIDRIQLKTTYSACLLPGTCIWKNIDSSVHRTYTFSYFCSCKYCAELPGDSWAIVVFLKTASFVVSQTGKDSATLRRDFLSKVSELNSVVGWTIVKGLVFHKTMSIDTHILKG